MLLVSFPLSTLCSIHCDVCAGVYLLDCLGKLLVCVYGLIDLYVYNVKKNVLVVFII